MGLEAEKETSHTDDHPQTLESDFSDTENTVTSRKEFRAQKSERKQESHEKISEIKQQINEKQTLLKNKTKEEVQQLQTEISLLKKTLKEAKKQARKESSVLGREEKDAIFLLEKQEANEIETLKQGQLLELEVLASQRKLSKGDDKKIRKEKIEKTKEAHKLALDKLSDKWDAQIDATETLYLAKATEIRKVVTQLQTGLKEIKEEITGTKKESKAQEKILQEQEEKQIQEIISRLNDDPFLKNSRREYEQRMKQVEIEKRQAREKQIRETQRTISEFLQSLGTISKDLKNKPLKQQVTHIANDLFDRNNIGWSALSVTDSVMQEALSRSTGENKSLENFLYNTPAERTTPKDIHSETRRLLSATTDKDILAHIEMLTGKTSGDLSVRETFVNAINVFTEKRSRQMLLLDHTHRIEKYFPGNDHFGLDTLRIDEHTYGIHRTVQYQGVQIPLQIDHNGKMMIPSLLARLGGRPEVKTILGSTKGQTNVLEALEKQASLSIEEIMQCKDMKEVEERITEKMNTYIETHMPHETTEAFKLTLAREKLLHHRNNFITHTDTADVTQSIPATYRHPEQILDLMTRITVGADGREPWTSTQLEKINQILTHKKFQEMFAKIVAADPVHGIEEFLTSIGCLDPQLSSTDLLGRFDALDQMASSGVASPEEEGYKELLRLLDPTNPAMKNTGTNTSTIIGTDATHRYQYTADKKIIKTSTT